MKPGTILTDYKIIKPAKENTLCNNQYNLNELKKIKELAQKEADEIICNAKKDAILEKEAILNDANKLLNEVIELKKNIENNYEQSLSNKYNLNIDDFIHQKDIEFSTTIEDFNSKFDLVFETAKKDIHDILLKSFENLFGISYDEPQYIKELLTENFVGFEDSKNIELILSKNAFDKFTNEIKVELENKLNITFDSIKVDTNLNGVILKTNLGSIEVDLNKQIELLKENLESCTYSN